METELIYDLFDDLQRLNLGADYRNSNYKTIKIKISEDKYMDIMQIYNLKARF
jgi:hypothetical protein